MNVRELTLLLACACAAPLPIVSHADEYLGEYRFGYNNSTWGSSGNMVLGVSHMGGTHYLVSGRLTKTSPAPTETGAVHGSAELLQGSVYLTLTYVDANGTDTISAVLSPDQLSGTFVDIGVFDKIEKSEGTIWKLP